MKTINLKTLHEDLLRIKQLLKKTPATDEVNPDWFVIIDDGKKKTSEILDDCGKLFSVWSYYGNEQLDKDFPPVKTKFKYRKNIEADENLKNKSAEDLEKEGIKGITLRERLLMEIQYFKKTGQHLDINNITLCSGSRYGDGGVPFVYWGGGGMRVFRCDPRFAGGGLRSRQQFTF